MGVDPAGLVDGDIGVDGHFAGTADLDGVGLFHRVADLGWAAIEKDEALFDHLVGAAAGAVALEGQIAVDAHGEGRRGRDLCRSGWLVVARSGGLFAPGCRSGGSFGGPLPFCLHNVGVYPARKQTPGYKSTLESTCNKGDGLI